MAAQGLEALLGVKAAARFLKTAWPFAPFVAHGPVARLKGLIDPALAEDLPALLRLPARATYAQVRKGARFSNTPVTPADALALHRDGLSIYCWDVTLENAQPWFAALRSQLGLDEELPHVGAFASRKNVGAPLHFDSQESFVVQLVGSKQWTLSPNRNVAFPSVNHVAADPVPPGLKYSWTGAAPRGVPPQSKRVVLRPGSVLFLPRGTWHATRTLRDSVHLDLMLPLPNWSDVLLPRLAAQLQHEAAWRAPAVGGEWEFQMAQQLADAAQALADSYFARRQGASKSTRASAKHSKR